MFEELWLNLTTNASSPRTYLGLFMLFALILAGTALSNYLNPKDKDDD